MIILVCEVMVGLGLDLSTKVFPRLRPSLSSPPPQPAQA
jgi:hypothetical protein